MAVERNSIIRARLCFSALEQPITGRDGQGEPRYRATLCIDKNDKESMKALKMIAENAYKEGFGAEALKTKKEGWSGINDGDKRDKGPDGIHDGCFYVNAKAKNKPILIDEARQETTKIYDGCYVNAMLYAYTYEYMGKRGVGYSFSVLQFAAPGQKIERKNSVVDAFPVLGPAPVVVEDSDEVSAPVEDLDDVFSGL